MVKIECTEEAKFWLKDIHDYIAQDNKRIAKKITKEIYSKVQILATFPQIGYAYRNDDNLEIRILLYGHYGIAYLIKDTNTIFVLGVFHGALDIKRYLK
ncbi:MAG: type II toxin-antitoxin system RelE/ParE family toxin [Epsilonproteobacteria bacterium]|nr:type II toxin-antitoxin system RelE/ParE family toxin [Campylobacterota bacterium]